MIPLSRPWLDDGEKEAVLRVVNSGWLVQGAEVERLEDIMSERLEAHAVAVSSGSMALILSLQALENQRRYVSHIIAPSYTFIATVSAILHVSAHPVLTDIDKRTYNLDANVLPVRDNGGASIDGIIAVHQVGLPCDVPAVTRRVPNAFIIEDAACAFGARVNGKEIGFGGGLVPATVAVCFSFHASKSIVAGEGGLVVMRDNAMAKEIRMLRDHGATVSADKRVGADGSYLEEVYARVGWNARMTDLCAAVAIEQIRKSSDILTHRRELAERYSEKLGTKFVTPLVPAGVNHAYQRYLVQCATELERDLQIERLREVGISCRRGLQVVHHQPCMADFRHVNLPVTEQVSKLALQIPLFPTMTLAEQDLVVETMLA